MSDGHGWWCYEAGSRRGMARSRTGRERRLGQAWGDAVCRIGEGGYGPDCLSRVDWSGEACLLGLERAGSGRRVGEGWSGSWWQGVTGWIGTVWQGESDRHGEGWTVGGTGLAW